jgi:hypothetical protein
LPAFIIQGKGLLRLGKLVYTFVRNSVYINIYIYTPPNSYFQLDNKNLATINNNDSRKTITKNSYKASTCITCPFFPKRFREKKSHSSTQTVHQVIRQPVATSWPGCLTSGFDLTFMVSQSHRRLNSGRYERLGGSSMLEQVQGPMVVKMDSVWKGIPGNPYIQYIYIHTYI